MIRMSIRMAVFALVLVAPIVANAALILVDDDGMQCPGALTSIQDAVNGAAAGDTIRVCAGTYFEEVTIDSTKTGLRLTGLGVVQLKAPLLGISPTGFKIEADGVQIEYFEISGFGDQCGILVTGQRAIVQNNDLHHNHFGICLQAGAQTRVRNNFVHENAFAGISTTDGSANEIAGNRVIASDTGIAVEADSDSVVHHNFVLGHRESAILLLSGSGTVVRNNTVRLAALGIVMFIAAGAEAVSNNVHDTLLGLVVFDCNGCTVSRNSVTQNNPGGVFAEGGGIFLEAIDASTIVQNIATRNGVVDCSWDGAGSNVFQRNACGVELPPGAWD
jgi:parallel beta-helix repeat protein